MVYNDWGLYRFVQMLSEKCLRAGKELYIISERDATKQCHRCGHLQKMPLWKRVYRCENCGLVMDRDDNSASTCTSERYLAWLRPCTDNSVPCTDVFTAIEDVDMTSGHI